MLSTPPAFILSQDQTLVKSVCIQFRINQLANSSLFTVVLVCLKTVLKNLLLKKFSRVVVVYCSVIKVLTSLCSFATAHLFYHKHFALSRTFLKFFIFLTSSLCFSESAHLYYHVFFRKSRTFLKFFYFLFTWFLTFFKIRRSRQTSVVPLFWFKLNGERGIWTLAPVARPTPLAGAPLQPLEYFSVHWILL